MNDWLRAFDGPLEQLGGGNAQVRDVLDRLLWRSQSARNAPVRHPVVTLMLSTGRELTGAVLACSEREPRTLTVAMSAGSERQLAFVPVAALVGLIVHDVTELGRPAPGVEVVGKLELARRLKAVADAHGVGSALEVGEDEGARLAVQLAVPLVDEAVRGILIDGEGTSAWRARVGTVVLKAGARDVTLEDKRLVIGVADAAQVPTAERLKRSIEALL